MNDGYVDRLRKGASLSSGISPILYGVWCRELFAVGAFKGPNVTSTSRTMCPETVARA